MVSAVSADMTWKLWTGSVCCSRSFQRTSLSTFFMAYNSQKLRCLSSPTSHWRSLSC